MRSRLAALPPRSRPARGPLARLLVGLWLVLHVFTVAAAPVADGFVDHRDEVVVHIEDVDGGKCPPAHSDACDLCQFSHGLRAIAAGSAGIGLPAVERRSPTPAAALALPADFAFLDGHSSRAPPALG
ncbi:MAG TPA: hypothetical protein PLY94_10805 [Gemmatimonadaceae bacterium]|nr:hypothetical protein [Gemmatimonadaceae bacterium]